MEDNEAQLQLAKRARRRLVGAIAFVSVLAVVLPIIMDDEPRPPMQDVEIRIPGQDETPFAPRLATERPAPPVAAPPVPDTSPRDEGKPAAKAAEKPAPKPADKPIEKAPEKPADKPAAKAADIANDKANDAADARRAAAILAGQPGAAAAGNDGEYLVLIGAFANEANVRNLQSKLGELGIKMYTEPLDTPQGRKTRVRAGPFASREAAEKALERMKKIGVSGVVAPRQ